MLRVRDAKLFQRGEGGSLRVIICSFDVDGE